MNNGSRKAELVEAVKTLYRHPTLHPPLTRNVCPLHEARPAGAGSGTYQCARCGDSSRHEYLGEEAYYAAYMAVEAAGDPGALAALDANQEAAAALRRLESARAALPGHPVTIDRLDAPALCRNCFPRESEIRVEVEARCLQCDRASHSVFDVDRFQELLTALWFHPSQLHAPALSVKIPLQFCIDHLFCEECRVQHFPAPFREPEYRFAGDGPR